MVFPEYTRACPEGVFQIRIPVAPAFTDEVGLMRPGDMARQMEKITQEHLESYGMSRESLRQEGKIWVIAWSAIHIRRRPAAGEEILLRVWPGKVKTMMYPRKYGFYSREGQCLACASSLFVLMDCETRSFAMPPKQQNRLPVIEIPHEPKLPPMRMPFPDHLPHKKIRVVRPSEIDRNGHLNNTHYLDWAQELVNERPLKFREPQFIWIQYMKELLEGQEVALHYGHFSDRLYIRGYAGDCEAWSMVVEFHHSCTNFDSFL